MSVVKLFFNDQNVDVKKEIIDKYLGEVDDGLKNNPSFISELYEAIHRLTTTSSESPNIPPIELYISDDNKCVELRGGIRPDPKCGNEILSKNNKLYEQIRFSLDENNNMDVLTSSGAFYMFSDFMRVSQGTEYKQQFSNLTPSDTPIVCSAYHTNKTFLSSGIELAISTYSDVYPLGGGMSMDSEREMRAQTMIHSPIKWYYNLVPGGARFESNPQKTNLCRMINDLGIVGVSVSNGLNTPIKYSEYISTTEYPEFIRVNPTPLFEYNKDGNPVLNDAYKSEFGDLNSYEIKKRINIGFFEGVENSRTKEERPLVYESLRELSLDALEARYGYTIPAENKEEVGYNR